MLARWNLSLHLSRSVFKLDILDQQDLLMQNEVQRKEVKRTEAK